MPVTDRRIPAVYVTIEDASYVAPTLEVGRTVMAAIVTERGPHNRVVTVSARDEYQRLFGKPNYRKCSQTHYQLDAALGLTNSALAIRVVPLDSTISFSQIYDTGSTIAAGNTITGDFTLKASSNLIYAPADVDYAKISIGDWISLTTSKQDAFQVVQKTDATKMLSADRTVNVTTSDITAQTLYRFVPYKAGAFQVSNNQGTASSYIKVETANEYINNLPLDSDNVFTFYANGAGQWYNSIKVKGMRNTTLEKMFTDADGNVLYKYCFMDIWVVQIDEDGNELLLEGPWEVSLMRKTKTGSVIRDISSGDILFMEDVINERSTFVRCAAGPRSDDLNEANNVDAEDKRLQIMLMISSASSDFPLLGTTNVSPSSGIQLEHGGDGTGMYENGIYQPSDSFNGVIKQAYECIGADVFGDSTDGTIEELKEAVYPWFEPDYILSGGFRYDIQTSAAGLADYRQDCIHLGDIYPIKYSYSDDLAQRKGDGMYSGWNFWTSMIYVQYRKMYDMYTGEKIWFSPVYHAIQRHLDTDAKYFIGEPVAGIEKGTIVDGIELAYKANSKQMGDLQDYELNYTIVEPQGKYFLSQLTTWKRLSILKRAHAAKFVAYIRRVIPKLLKDILQRKATQYWINQAKFRVDNFLSAFLENPALERYSILKSFTSTVQFDDVRSELNVYIDITPIRAIERINVYIIVH
jgi:hypothetical protein